MRRNSPITEADSAFVLLILHRFESSGGNIERQSLFPAIIVSPIFPGQSHFGPTISIKQMILIRATVLNSTTIINGNSLGNNIDQQ
jgi:hypothetical protein